MIHGRIETISDNEKSACRLAKEVLDKIGVVNSKTKTYPYDKMSTDTEKHYMTDFNMAGDLDELNSLINNLGAFSDGIIDDVTMEDRTMIVDSRNGNININNVFWIMIGAYND